MTPITYQQAADLLGCSIVTINKAVGRGALSKAPSLNLKQNVIKEQVLLFKGKQIRETMLSDSEKELYYKLKEASEKSQQVTEEVPQEKRQNMLTERVQRTENMSVAMPLFNLDRSALEYLDERKLAMHTETPSGSMSFHSALVDELDSVEDRSFNAILEAKPSLGFAILLGLIILLFIFLPGKTKAKKQAEETIEKIGLEKEDLVTNRRKVIDKLKEHPSEAKKLKYILKKENLLEEVA